ncbi:MULTISPECIES: hypothetical protein, partial [unclassified Catenibacterium]|uniref:hypothetical protein n=2 Tax=unclassified Catenibacterium TaxID=2643636 RepID=UPI001EE87111
SFGGFEFGYIFVSAQRRRGEMEEIMRSYLYVYKIKKEESSDIFLRICHSIENTLHPSFIENEIVDFDQSRIQRYIFPDNRILLYDDIQSDCIIMQTDQPCTLSTLME